MSFYYRCEICGVRMLPGAIHIHKLASLARKLSGWVWRPEEDYQTAEEVYSALSSVV